MKNIKKKSKKVLTYRKVFGIISHVLEGTQQSTEN